MTESSGLGFEGFCHGIVAGDIDNDGDQDVFLCNYGSNALYFNNGNGTFTDISKAAGIDAPTWSSGGALLDYDNDGYLDIYVSNYGRWKFPEDHQSAATGRRRSSRIARRDRLRPCKHLLYHNNGDDTFTDVYEKVILDTDPEDRPRSRRRPRIWRGRCRLQCRRPDRHLRRQRHEPEFPVLNRGDGTFEDVTEISGAAFNVNGNAQSGMGVDAEDVNGDGLPELFVTNFSNEYNTLYQNSARGSFMDNTAFFGLAADTLPWVGWGCAPRPTSTTTAGPTSSS